MDLGLGDVLVRLLAAAGAGGLIGLNRDLADKPIGVRTLGLVSLGAATVSVAGIQVHGMAENPDAMSRVVQGIIQGVMAGISFIGAGVILRNVQTRNVEGLTTAATVWVSAALGVACGLGAWRTIAIAIPVTLAMLFATGWIDRLTKRSSRNDERGSTRLAAPKAMVPWPHARNWRTTFAKYVNLRVRASGGRASNGVTRDALELRNVQRLPEMEGVIMQ